MRHLNGLFAFYFATLFVFDLCAVGHQQPGVGESLHHLPRTGLQFAQPHTLACVHAFFGCRGNAHQPGEHTFRSLLLLGSEPVELLFGALADGAFDLTDFVVLVVSEQTALAFAPQFGQGKFQQGQIARLAFVIVQDAAVAVVIAQEKIARAVGLIGLVRKIVGHNAADYGRTKINACGMAFLG